MGTAFLHGNGGGGSLNFKVVGGTIQPSNPSENMNWIVTDKKITGWIFSEDEPDAPFEGMVWNVIAGKSSVKFNALKKNIGIMISPSYARQYISGAWVDVESKIYQNGKWIDWYSGEWIIKNGRAEYDVSLSPELSMTQNLYDITFTGSAFGWHEVYVKVDLSDFNTMTIEGIFPTGDTRKLAVWDLSVVPDQSTVLVTSDYREVSAKLEKSGASLDISDLRGEYFVGFTTEFTEQAIVTNWVLE